MEKKTKRKQKTKNKMRIPAKKTMLGKTRRNAVSTIIGKVHEKLVEKKTYMSRPIYIHCAVEGCAPVSELFNYRHLRRGIGTGATNWHQEVAIAFAAHTKAGPIRALARRSTVLSRSFARMLTVQKKPVATGSGKKNDAWFSGKKIKICKS